MRTFFIYFCIEIMLFIVMLSIFSFLKNAFNFLIFFFVKFWFYIKYLLLVPLGVSFTMLSFNIAVYNLVISFTIFYNYIPAIFLQLKSHFGSICCFSKCSGEFFYIQLFNFLKENKFCYPRTSIIFDKIL
jgi:hypothetical protein